ncbi:TetR/AcrR family transcriptional regulator [Streptomyces sp. JW3]|uniref:TetR/AcrR family transcriptional regulator n=1 Tax=Streptomyces sp. JW3 TaxID=3456955 RepID=UPI003FA4264B
MSAEQISDSDSAKSTGGPRGRYAKSKLVRRNILEACIEAFSVAGFHGATMKDIAQRAGISQTGLMHHFPDKAGLLIEVLRRRDEQMSELMETTGERDFFHAQLGVVRDNESRPGLLQLHTTISAEATDAGHPAHTLYRQRYDDLRLYLETLFERERGTGHLRTDASPRALANLFVGALDGLQLQWLYNPAEVDVAESLEALVDTLLTDISPS